ncbi:tyrosine-protein phosphatase [Emticicia sp. SJ17W-69]|uniref:tyrosine-protein phosphatase n=1 Tax=Emticicia sp. SJ17W-69 TaxID=3421657 RepID=UPI003EBB2A41
MFDALFKKRDLGEQLASSKYSIAVDVHAHILPQLDDGAANIEQSIEMIKSLSALGYRKIIATPHVMNGYYNNASEDILQALYILKSVLRRKNIDIEIEAAAEYYLDDELFRLIDRNDVLTFGGEKKYLLFETSFVTRPSYILESTLKIKKAGYTPVLAHPERYTNLNDIEVLNRLSFNGLLFQINIGSLTGSNSKQSQEFAELLINQKLVSFLGTNCHNEAQLKNVKAAMNLPFYEAVLKQNLRNNSLLETKKKELISI